MAHYDFLHEDFLVEDVDMAIANTFRNLKRNKDERSNLLSDMSTVQTVTTATLISNKVSKLDREIKLLSDKLDRWKVVKDKIESGIKYTYSDAHNYVDRKW